jgi:hypothetical protein
MSVLCGIRLEHPATRKTAGSKIIAFFKTTSFFNVDIYSIPLWLKFPMKIEVRHRIEGLPKQGLLRIIQLLILVKVRIYTLGEFGIK